MDIDELMTQFINTTDASKFQILRKIFDYLKTSVSTTTGLKFASTLTQLKDAILETVGTSLALFDLSKATQEVKNIDTFSADEVRKLQDRIGNWAQRLVK